MAYFPSGRLEDGNGRKIGRHTSFDTASRIPSSFVHASFFLSFDRPLPSISMKRDQRRDTVLRALEFWARFVQEIYRTYEISYEIISLFLNGCIVFGKWNQSVSFETLKKLNQLERTSILNQSWWMENGGLKGRDFFLFLFSFDRSIDRNHATRLDLYLIPRKIPCFDKPYVNYLGLHHQLKFITRNPFNDNTTNSIFFSLPSPPSLHKLSSQLNFALKSHYPVPSCDHRFLFLLHCFTQSANFWIN